MASELDVTPATGGEMVDPLYKEIYGEGGGQEVAPRQIGFPIIPAFTHYVLKPLKATRRRSQTNVGARVQVEVVEGPEGTVGHKFTDSGEVGFGFIVARTKGKDRQQITEEEWRGKCRSRNGMFNRVRVALGLTMAAPPNCFIGMVDMPDAAVDAYAAQFENAQKFVAAVTIEVGMDGVSRNKVDWGSVAGLNEEATDQRGRPLGITAHEEAKGKIAAYKPETAKGGGR